MHKIVFVQNDELTEINDILEPPNGWGPNWSEWHVKSIHSVANDNGAYAYVVLTSEDDYIAPNN